MDIIAANRSARIARFVGNKRRANHVEPAAHHVDRPARPGGHAVGKCHIDERHLSVNIDVEQVVTVQRVAIFAALALAANNDGSLNNDFAGAGMNIFFQRDRAAHSKHNRVCAAAGDTIWITVVILPGGVDSFTKAARSVIIIFVV